MPAIAVAVGGVGGAEGGEAGSAQRVAEAGVGELPQGERQREEGMVTALVEPLVPVACTPTRRNSQGGNS